MSAAGKGTRPLRVLHVIDSLCRGGAESLLAAMLRELADHHPQVHSVVRAGRIEEADPQLVASVTRDTGRLAFLRSEHVYDPRFAAGLARAIRGDEIDVVHSHLAVASVNSRLAARALGRAHLTSIHTMPGSTLTDTRAWLAADALTARLSHLLVAPSEEVAAACARHYRLGRERLRIIPNAPAAAPVRVADRGALRAELFGAAGDGPLLLCIARLVPGKGIDDLLDATASLGERVAGLHVAVAGAGPSRPDWRRRSRSAVSTAASSCSATARTSGACSPRPTCSACRRITRRLRSACSRRWTPDASAWPARSAPSRRCSTAGAVAC